MSAPDPKFAALPLDAQLSWLEDALDRKQDPRTLLRTCAAVRDHAPLSWLARRLLTQGWLDKEPEQSYMAQFLLEQPETAVDRVLKALIGDGTFSVRQRPALRDTLLHILRTVGVDRVSVMCLVDRALKHNFVEARDEHVEQLTQRCIAAIERGLIDEVTVDNLAQISAPGIEQLRSAAAVHSSEVADTLAEKLQTLAQRALEVLGQAPKAVSQANAEELLSKRVYTDPGHFLVELLQNAEDAGARCFQLQFFPRKIILWHDGQPFDTRDVVGVTSIGQTTKRKQQIGFFGVGFKSVYEVTDRPQIYSDIYRFEIADVSIPKALSERPADVPDNGTVLVLPLRNPDDPERSPAALYAKARALDAIVLFTLRRIDMLALELHNADGTTIYHTVHELAPDERGISRIRQEPDGWVRGYAVHDAEYVYAGGNRAPGRADRTRVMVGLRVDDGIPRALEPDTPTIYSYLPTEEHSGLRFFVQGHFDVPVDRERITQDSRWNEWILGKVPQGLARLAQGLLVDLSAEDQAQVAAGLLCVLPLRGELGSPIFRRIVGGLRGAFADLAVIPCGDGSLQPPRASVVADESLATLLEGQPVGTAEGTRHLVRTDLDPRAIEVARLLGAGTYGVRDLIDCLERVLSPLPDGARVEQPDAPRFLREPTAARLYACYERLDEAVMRRVGGGTRRMADLSTMRRLRALPLVLSEDGALHRPGPVVRAAPALRSIYTGLRAFVDPALDAAVDPEDPSRVTATAFLERLGVKVLGVRELVEDLEAQLGGLTEPLADLQTTRLPGDHLRLHAVLTLVAEASSTLQRRVARLPVFLAQDGRYHRAAANPGDRGGVLRFEAGPLADRLLAFYGGSRPICAQEEDDPALALLRSARTPTLSLEVLVADLRAQADTLDTEQLDRVHALLEALRDDLPARTRRELAELRLWPDTHGVRRPLRGEGAAMLPGSPAIAALLPQVPFVHAAVLARAHTRDMGGEELGIDALVDALRPEAEAPRRIEPEAANVEAVLEVLCAEREQLNPRLRAQLAEVPAFLDDMRRPGTLDTLSLVEDPQLRAVYGAWPGRRFVDPQSPTRAAIEQLDLDGRLHRADATTLADDLRSLEGQLDGADVNAGSLPLLGDGAAHLRLLQYCAEQAPALPRAVVRRLSLAAIHPDHTGRLGPLGENRGPRSPAAVYASEPGLHDLFVALGVRTLAPAAQQAAQALLEAAGHEPLDAVALVEQLEPLRSLASGQPRHPVQADATLTQIQAALLEHAPLLAHRFPPQPGSSQGESSSPQSPVLGALAVWSTIAGGVITANEAVDAEVLLALLPEGSGARQRLDSVTLEAGTGERLRQLAPLVAPATASSFAVSLVRDMARPDAALSQQPSWLQHPATVAQLAQLIEPEDGPRPVIDATGTLRLIPLQRASAETVALVEGTELATRLVHPAMLEALESPELFEPVTPGEVLDTLVGSRREPGPVGEHPLLNDAARRARLYAWLTSHESTIFTDADARVRLRTWPLFMTDRGTIRPADQLVIDPDLPALDVDWTPHSELPASTLDLLVRHLGVGRPPVEDLVADHLAPAYHRATRQGDGVGAGRLLEYLARALATARTDEVRSLMTADGPVLVEGAHERFVPASELLLPPAELMTAIEAVFGTNHPPPHPRLPTTTHALLQTLGVGRMPPRRWVTEAMHGGIASAAIATGLAILIAHLYADDSQATLAELPLREVAWVLDGNDLPRRPADLFMWTTDVQALVGDSPALYPAPSIARALSEELCEALGFRGAADVRLTEVIAHIDGSREAEIPVPFRVYQWLERGLAEGWLDATHLQVEFGERAWICSDDGEYHPHTRVLGFRALEYFGSRRGYWERGREHCPTLCRAFRISNRLSPTTLLGFTEEIAAAASKQGDRALLEAEPGLPRMLLRAYAALGAQEQPAPASVVLCRQCGGDEPETLRLCKPEDPLVMRSDAPALEAMFAAAGRFYVAAPGPLDDRVAIDAYYERCGIRRLRDSYEVRVARGSEDQTRAYAEAIGPLRTCLLGLLATLPRVRLQRTHLAAEAWVYETRLAPLARTGRIAVRAGLEVDYVLTGVGRARTRAVAVFDPGTGALLVDTQVFSDPTTHITGLAQGLMPCIYEGPSEEQLVDIVEILLRLQDRARMDAYLDQRFFPTASEADPGLGGRLATRVGELFDYGLDRRLQLRFDALRGRPLERWREPALFTSLPEDPEQAVRTVVTRMLDAIELTEANQALVEALALLLSARSLSDVPAGLLAPETTPVPEVPDPVTPPRGAQGDRRPSRTPTSSDDPELMALDDLSLDDLEARLAELTSRTGSDGSSSGLSNHLPHASDRPRAMDEHPTSLPPWLDDLEVAEPDDALPTATERPGFWGRLARSLGLVDEQPLAERRPAWADPGANVLSPAGFVGPQLWVRGRTLRKMATERIPMGLLHQPRVLPSPYRYVVHTLGGAFRPRTQQWHPIPLSAMPGLMEGPPTGASVAFAGTVAPGRSVLPTPLYGDIVRMEVVDAEPSKVRVLGRMPSGGAVIEFEGPESIQLRYDVGLRQPPTLTDGRVTMGQGLEQPTVARSELPDAVREWLERTADHDRGAWEQARRVEAFVQRRYIYDLEFRERPEVERAASQLQPGVGNHHLQLLHASADRDALGYGVCYELNVLVVELLRHLGIPAFVAIGWMLDEGFADRPDHLFALAVVPSIAGPCLLPLDASTGPRGPVRPLAGAEPPSVDLLPEERPAIADVHGGWGTPVLPGPERDVAIDEHVHALHRSLRSALDREREALRRAIRIIDAARGRSPTPLDPDLDVAALRQQAAKGLSEPALLAPLLAVIHGEYDHTTDVPASVQALIRDGLATVETRPGYRVRPADVRTSR